MDVVTLYNPPVLVKERGLKGSGPVTGVDSLTSPSCGTLLSTASRVIRGLRPTRRPLGTFGLVGGSGNYSSVLPGPSGYLPRTLGPPVSEDSWSTLRSVRSQSVPVSGRGLGR